MSAEKEVFMTDIVLTWKVVSYQSAEFQLKSIIY